jgi:hypothetical protein
MIPIAGDNPRAMSATVIRSAKCEYVGCKKCMARNGFVRHSAPGLARRKLSMCCSSWYVVKDIRNETEALNCLACSPIETAGIDPKRKVVATDLMSRIDVNLPLQIAALDASIGRRAVLGRTAETSRIVGQTFSSVRQVLQRPPRGLGGVRFSCARCHLTVVWPHFSLIGVCAHRLA